jgi:hypothetical protein
MPLQTKKDIFLDQQTIRSFAATRARIRKAVANQTSPVTLKQALSQVKRK